MTKTSTKLSITLHIDIGNIIYKEFEDAQEAIAFIQHYAHNPQAILKKITPQKNSKQTLFDLENEPPIEPSGDSPI